MNKGFTVRELYKACQKEIEKGNGNKYIVISNDNEGNGFHTLFFLFTSDERNVNALADYFDDKNDPRNTIILG